LFWIGKIHRVRPRQNTKCIEATSEEHEFNVDSNVNNMKPQRTTASGYHAAAIVIFFAFLLCAVDVVWIIAHLLCLQLCYRHINYASSFLFMSLLIKYRTSRFNYKGLFFFFFLTCYKGLFGYVFEVPKSAFNTQKVRLKKNTHLVNKLKAILRV
jgi:hypothetical protein